MKTSILKILIPILLAPLLMPFANATDASVEQNLGRRKLHISPYDNLFSTQDLSPNYNYLLPRFPVTPFYQWDANNGYCGEVSIMQAGMSAGLWLSQYNARLICGSGLSQSGVNGFCEAHNGTADFNSQVLLERPRAGDKPFASAGQCLENAKLNYQLYDYWNSPGGMQGYRRFMSWIKTQLIAGNQVAIGVFNFEGTDAQYDHEVTVAKVATRHSPHDSNYYDDDIIFLEDHEHGGFPFQRGFTFRSLAKTRKGANSKGAQTYSILIPGEKVLTLSGGDGLHANPNPMIGSDFGFSVSGPKDKHKMTLPVRLRIVGSSIDGVPHTPHPANFFNFESPELASQCTNRPPRWMNMQLEVKVENLIPGKHYNLYAYEANSVQGFGSAAALKIPEENFNANASAASKVEHFVATASTFSQVVQITSDRVLAFRCVRAEAP